MDKVFKYGALEARFDISDFKHLERADKAFGELSDIPAKADAAEGHIEKIKIMFYAFSDLLDHVLDDPDATNKALGGTASLDDIMTAVFGFIDFIRAQDSALAERWTTLTKKYSPNRAQRRAK
jgi:hypothetical protein